MTVIIYDVYNPRFGERIQNSYSLQAEQAGAGQELQGREINYTWADWAELGRAGHSIATSHSHTTQGALLTQGKPITLLHLHTSHFILTGTGGGGGGAKESGNDST